MRTRMDWDWVEHYPFFIYTTFLNHFEFQVKIVKGEKDNQNAPGYGPSAPAWMEYTQEGLASKAAVVDLAFKIIRRKMRQNKTLRQESYERRIHFNIKSEVHSIMGKMGSVPGIDAKCHRSET